MSYSKTIGPNYIYIGSENKCRHDNYHIPTAVVQIFNLSWLLSLSIFYNISIYNIQYTYKYCLSIIKFTKRAKLKVFIFLNMKNCRAFKIK